MKRLSKFTRNSLYSGVVWSLLAILLSEGVFGYAVIGGVVAAPAIGWLISKLFRPFYRYAKLVQFFVSLPYLYMGVLLFGVAIGVARAMEHPSVSLWNNILEATAGALWGTTFIYLIVFWPLAFANFRLLEKSALEKSSSDARSLTSVAAG